MTELEVVHAGALTTVQDLGRRGWAHLGVPRGGALDEPALRLANRLVGNPEDTAGLETTLTGCALRFTTAVTVAVTGAVARVTVGGRPADPQQPLDLSAGDVLDVGRATAGVRSYIAVRGGVAVAPTLGSRSTDTLAGLGPPPLRDGMTLPVGGPPAAPSTSTTPGADTGAPATGAPTPGADDGARLRVRLGPREDALHPDSLAALTATAWRVSPASNRVGVRLEGPTLSRRGEGELPSEGVVLGAVQVPADGRPLVFMADHPTTGGYPVVAVVETDDLPLLAQARPGSRLRLTTDLGAPW